MQARWLGPHSVSTGSVSEQTRGPDLLPTIPGTVLPDAEASPEPQQGSRRKDTARLCATAVGTCWDTVREGGCR